MTNWVRYPGAMPPPTKRGISAILARYHMKTRQNSCDTPSVILSRKGLARYGEVSCTGPLRSGAGLPPEEGLLPKINSIGKISGALAKSPREFTE